MLINYSHKKSLIQLFLASNILVFAATYLNTAHGVLININANKTNTNANAGAPAVSGVDTFNFTADVNLTFETPGFIVPGPNSIDSNAPNQGTVIFQEPTTINGTIGATQLLKSLVFDVAFKNNVDINGAVEASNLNFINDGIANFNGTVGAVTPSNVTSNLTFDGQVAFNAPTVLNNVTLGTAVLDKFTAFFFDNLTINGNLQLNQDTQIQSKLGKIINIVGTATFSDISRGFFNTGTTTGQMTVSNSAGVIFDNDYTVTGGITLNNSGFIQSSPGKQINIGPNPLTLNNASNAVLDQGTAGANIAVNNNALLQFQDDYTITNNLDITGTPRVSVVGNKTVTINGAFTDAGGGTRLIFDMNNNIIPGKFDITGGVSTINNTQKVNIINYNVALYPIGATTVHPLITNTGGGGGVVSLPNLTPSTNPFLIFALNAPDANTLNLLVTRTAPTNLDKNANSVAEVLIQIDPTYAKGALLDLLDGVGDVGITSEKLNTALYQVMPQGMNRDLAGAGFRIINTTFDLFNRRIEELKTDSAIYNSGYAAGTSDEKGRGSWVKIFGHQASQGQRDNFSGFKAETWGLIAGADVLITENVLAGGALSWASTDINSDSQQGGTDLNNYQALLYGSWNITSPLQLKWGTSIAFNQYKEKQIASVASFNQTSLGDFDGWQYAARGELAYALGEPFFRITPSLGLTYVHVEFDEFTQKGSSTANQIIAYDNINMLLASAGLKFSHDKKIEKALLSSEIHGNISYDIIGDKQHAKAQFIGFPASYEVEHFFFDRWDYNLGASITTWGDCGLGFSLSYDYNWKKTSHSNSGFIRVRYEW